MNSVGIPDDILTRIKMGISRPHGVILVTGPTGSGKTTTLYGCLNELNLPGKKIITVEDPIEYSIPRINQVQVQPKIELTFARVLRACLRQDPDIIMIGEMRDSETAAIGLRASITGHLVLSTLHTNDAVSTAVRLIDMGLEPFLVASALQLVIAQRLIRKICQFCITDHQLDETELFWASRLLGEKAVQINFKKGTGCDKCANTGYKGRIGVYELLELSGPVRVALRSGDTALFTKLARESKNYRPLVYSAMDQVEAGLSTFEEVIKLASGMADDEDEAAETSTHA